MIKPKIIISFSGGMDSTSLLLHYLVKGYEVDCYSFDYGQRHNIELKRGNKLIKLLQKHHLPVTRKIIKLNNVAELLYSSLTPKSGGSEVPQGHYNEESMKQTVVPNRNAIFTSILYGVALSTLKVERREEIGLGLGVHKGDYTTYPDCRPEFYESFIKSLALGNYDGEKVKLQLPFLNYTKKEILLDAQLCCIDLELAGLVNSFNKIFRLTNTCYQPNAKGKSCGKCGSCIERVEAFISIGKSDPVKYIDKWDEIVVNYHKVKDEYQNNLKSS